MDINQAKIATIHDFLMDFESMGERLEELRNKFPSGVIIPVIERDLQSPALTRIVSGLNECRYLEKVFIALSASTQENYTEALRLFRSLKVPFELSGVTNRKSTPYSEI